MEFNLSASPQDEPDYIDLCTILKGEKPLELPKHFNGISGKKKLISALKIRPEYSHVRIAGLQRFCIDLFYAASCSFT